jgi:hypothetical protein
VFAAGNAAGGDEFIRLVQVAPHQQRDDGQQGAVRLPRRSAR